MDSWMNVAVDYGPLEGSYSIITDGSAPFGPCLTGQTAVPAFKGVSEAHSQWVWGNTKAVLITTLVHGEDLMGWPGIGLNW